MSGIPRVTRVFRLKWDSFQQMKWHFEIRRMKRFKKEVRMNGLGQMLTQRERRLDTILWKSGLADSVWEAKQLIKSDLVRVNGKDHVKRDIYYKPDLVRPGLLLEIGDIASILNPHNVKMDSKAAENINSGAEVVAAPVETAPDALEEDQPRVKVTPEVIMERLRRKISETSKGSVKDKLFGRHYNKKEDEETADDDNDEDAEITAPVKIKKNPKDMTKKEKNQMIAREFRKPPFHLDVHYGAMAVILSDTPDPKKIDYPFMLF